MPDPKPTRSQLAYLKSLAARTGGTFAYPTTRAQASNEIKRLLAAKATPAGDRAREHQDLQRDIAERSDDATAVREHDTVGWGSTARWAHHPDDGGR